jgi:hypothetical protein
MKIGVCALCERRQRAHGPDTEAEDRKGTYALCHPVMDAFM